VENAGRQTFLSLVAGASLLMAACGGSGGSIATSYVLTVQSSNPSAGVSIALTAAGSNETSRGTTSFSRTYNAGESFTLTAPARSGINNFASWSGCASASTVTCALTMDGNKSVTAVYVTPLITTPGVIVTPSSSSILTTQGLSVSVVVSGATGYITPTGAVTLSSGSYSSAPITLAGGSATFIIPANALSAGSDSLKAVFNPDTTSAPIYTPASGTASVKVTVPPKISPAVSVTPSLFSITTGQALTVTVAINGGSGNAIPTGMVTLGSGKYISSPVTLSGGSASILVPAGSLAVGSNTLVASYSPDASSSSTYNPVTGASAPVTVTLLSTITINQSGTGPAVTSRLLGMNMGYWYDPSTPEIVPAFQTAGIRSIRWPGGSGASDYHWATNSLCGGGITFPAADFPTFIADVIRPGNFDLALTANYATNAACTGPGDPAEAAAWVLSAKNNGDFVTHVTVGNEAYGSWEEDLHPIPHDPATYADATANSYYPQIKAANPNVLVGVDVNPWNPSPWDSIVLAAAKYDFVEFHYYPEAPGNENDVFLVQQAAQQLTTGIDAIKAELKTAGHPDTPIYIGEIGSVYSDPGKQTSSITQALYAGQVLGEMMNDGVSLATWWIGFGGCLSDPSVQNFSSSLYGWQNFGGYMVFSDGLPEYGCAGSSIPTLPAGTLLPTARAFQLFSRVAIDGESVLTANVTGDTTDVRAYAATNNGGTALVVFNLNQAVSAPITVTLSRQSTSSSVTIETYSKSIYDQSKTNVWAAPTMNDLGAQTLPLPLTLAPWSMNVVIIK
jgi:hypothetical protein